jgi:hypothetical protein
MQAPKSAACAQRALTSPSRTVKTACSSMAVSWGLTRRRICECKRQLQTVVLLHWRMRTSGCTNRKGGCTTPLAVTVPPASSDRITCQQRPYHLQVANFCQSSDSPHFCPQYKLAPLSQGKRSIRSPCVFAGGYGAVSRDGSTGVCKSRNSTYCLVDQG